VLASSGREGVLCFDEGGVRSAMVAGGLNLRSLDPREARWEV